MYVAEESADNDEEDIARQQQLCLTPLVVRGSTAEKVSSHQPEDQGGEEEADLIGDDKRLLSDVIDDNMSLEKTMPKQKKPKRSKVTTPKMKKKASPKPRLLRSTAKRRGIVLNTMGEIMN